MIDCTLVLAVDAEHLPQLWHAVHSWRAYKADLWRMPLVVFYDARSVQPQQLEFLAWPTMRCVAWDYDAPTQRERMLSAFVLGAARYVETPWYFKLDCDTIATGFANWCPDWWFESEPAWVAQRWGYTKPGCMLDALDAWALTVPELRERPAPPREYRGNVARHRRMISWAQFGNTAWLKRIVEWFDGRMPCASQDTTLSYVAERMGAFTRTVDMKAAGWAHVGSGRVRQAVEGVLSCCEFSQLGVRA